MVSHRWENYRESITRAKKKYRDRHGDRIRAADRRWYVENKETRKKYYDSNKEEVLKKTRQKRMELRIQALKALGGKCSICGFDDWRALQIDHVNGGGSAHRKRVGGGSTFYRHVLKRADSGEFQVLCANHNWIKRYERGETPNGPASR